MSDQISCLRYHGSVDINDALDIFDDENEDCQGCTNYYVCEREIQDPYVDYIDDVASTTIDVPTN